MKKINSHIVRISLFQAILLFAAMTATAQRPLNASQKQRQQVVRQAYTNAQAYAEQQKKDRYAGNVFTAKWQRIEPAVGQVVETIEFFSNAKEDSQTGMTFYVPLLVRNSYKRSEATIGDTYEEFLFNTDTEKLMFYYKTSNYWWADEEVKMETRCYYNADGTFCSGSIKLTPLNGGAAMYPDELQDLDGYDALRMQERYKQVFNSMTNFTME